jgi:hypothetical protein
MCYEILPPVNICKHHRFIRLHLVTYFDHYSSAFIGLYHATTVCQNEQMQVHNQSVIHYTYRLQVAFTVKYILRINGSVGFVDRPEF